MKSNQLASGICLALLLIWPVYGVTGEDVMIENGRTVKLDYTLTINEEVIDSTQGKDPLEYVHGSGNIIPGLEAELEGMKVGDTKSVVIAAKDAYGDVDQEAFKEVPKEALPQDAELKQGLILEVEAPDGSVFPAVVWEVKEESVVLNFNHPLAGQDLTFDIKIVSIE